MDGAGVSNTNVAWLALENKDKRRVDMEEQNILERDATGKCNEGECRDRVLEGQEERQNEIRDEETSTGEGTSSVSDAKSRNEPPGALGGHV
jgi:hypothetical protein